MTDEAVAFGINSPSVGISDVDGEASPGLRPIEPPRVYRRVKLSKDDLHERETINLQIHTQVIC